MKPYKTSILHMNRTQLTDDKLYNINKEIISSNIPIDSEFEIFTICTKFNDNIPILLDNLKLYNIDPVVFIAPPDNWLNTFKPIIFYNYLKQSTKTFILFLDSYDVVLVDHPNIILEKYKKLKFKKNCKIIFNADYKHHMKYLSDVDAIELKKFEENTYKMPTCYLNAGVCIGDRDALLYFYNQCVQEIYKLNPEFKLTEVSINGDYLPSNQLYSNIKNLIITNQQNYKWEQPIVKIVHKRLYPLAQIDDDSELAIRWNKQSIIKEIGEEK